MEKKNSAIRIAIVGPESTGKSTLSRDLANYYASTYVDEFARTYLENLDRKYILGDLTEIAKGQVQQEDEKALSSKGFIFCDTTLLTIKIWAQNAFKMVPPFVSKNIHSYHYPLYLLCDIDHPWIPDPLREHPHLRGYFMKRHIHELEKMGMNYEIISGEGKNRVQRAIEVIQKHFFSEDTETLLHLRQS